MQITVTVSNEGARVAQKDLRSFLRHCDRKMSGEVPDRRNSGAKSYVILRRVHDVLKREIDAQERRWAEEREANKPPPPTVREVRGR